MPRPKRGKHCRAGGGRLGMRGRSRVLRRLSARNRMVRSGAAMPPAVPGVFQPAARADGIAGSGSGPSARRDPRREARRASGACLSPGACPAPWGRGRERVASPSPRPGRDRHRGGGRAMGSRRPAAACDAAARGAAAGLCAAWRGSAFRHRSPPRARGVTAKAVESAGHRARASWRPRAWRRRRRPARGASPKTPAPARKRAPAPGGQAWQGAPGALEEHPRRGRERSMRGADTCTSAPPCGAVAASCAAACPSCAALSVAGG